MRILFFLLGLTVATQAFITNTTIQINPGSIVTFELFSNGTLTYLVNDNIGTKFDVYLTRLEWISDSNYVSKCYLQYSRIGTTNATFSGNYSFDSGNELVLAILNNNLFTRSITSVFINNTAFPSGPRAPIVDQPFSRAEMLSITAQWLLLGFVIIITILFAVYLILFIRGRTMISDGNIQQEHVGLLDPSSNSIERV